MGWSARPPHGRWRAGTADLAEAEACRSTVSRSKHWTNPEEPAFSRREYGCNKRSAVTEGRDSLPQYTTQLKTTLRKAYLPETV